MSQEPSEISETSISESPSLRRFTLRLYPLVGDSTSHIGTDVRSWAGPGYVGGQPEQPPRDVIATMAAMSDEQFPPDVPPHWSVDFWADDVDGAAEATARLGGKVIAPPYDIPEAELRQAILADPQGASFSVTKVTAGE